MAARTDKSKGIKGYGTTLTIGTDVVVEMIKVTPGKKKRSTVDLTSLDSPGGYKEKTGGLRDCEDVQATIMYEPTMEGKLDTAFDSDVEQAFVITYPNTKTDSWNGFMTELGKGEVTADGSIVNTIAIAINGKVTRGPGGA